MMPTLPSGSVTFLFTDIEGSTRLWEHYPQTMQTALDRHDTCLRTAIETQNGHVFKTVGDAFYAVFIDASKAISAAIAIQRILQAEHWVDIEPIKVRIALHTGTAEQRNHDYFGPTLNRIARLVGSGHGGQILLSSTAADRVQSRLPEKVSLRDLGEHRLKDLPTPERIFQLVVEDLPTEFPALRTLDFIEKTLVDVLEITTFGGITVRSQGKLIGGFVSRKAEALLVYLACTGRPQSREVLADLLWDDRPLDQALANLRTILANLRKQLKPYIDSTHQTVGLDITRLRLDVTALEAGLTLASKDWQRGRKLSPASVSGLEQALNLYRGSFLEGFSIFDSRGFEDWMRIERERLQQLVIEGLHHLTESYIAQGSYNQAISRATRLLQLDSFREAAYGQLMIALTATGQRTKALEQYEICQRLLDQELETSPSQELIDLREQIRTGKLTIVPPSSVIPVVHNLPTGDLSIIPPTLPYPVTPFIGRIDELHNLDKRLNDPACRLLTLVGPGGIGKTRLALQVAQNNIPCFKDGVYFVSLAPLSTPTAIIPSIAEAVHFNFYPQGDSDQHDSRRQLLDYLSTKHLLLVLDNVEHLLVGVNIVVDILQRSPQIKIVATSRERLNIDGENVVRVESLDCPDWKTSEDALQSSAVELFLQSARRILANFAVTQNNLNDIVRICRLVGGMPLGILLAAAWVEVLPLPEIAREIQNNLDFLRSDQKDLPIRQVSMRAAFEYSWSLLSETERDVFKKLSVFRGGFTREAAEQVAHANLRSLITLVNKSLVRSDLTTGRYDIHELLRQYAQEYLAKSETELTAILEAHCLYYADFMAQQWEALKTERQPLALNTIEHELDNVRVAWEYMLQHFKIAEIKKTMLSLWHFFSMRSHYQEALDVFSKAVDALKAAPAPSTEEREIVLVHLICIQGRFYMATGQEAKGRAAIEASVKQLPRSINAEDMIVPLESLVYAAMGAGQLVKARQTIEEGLQVARQIGDQWSEAWFLYWLTLVVLANADYEEAQAIADESLSLATICGDLWLRACLSVFVLGKTAIALKEYVAAIQHVKHGLGFFQEIGQPWGISVSYWSLANTAFLAQDYEDAEHYFKQSLQIFYSTGQNQFTLTVLYDTAKLLIAQDKKERALQFLTLITEHADSRPEVRQEAAALMRELQPNSRSASDKKATLDHLLRGFLDS